MITCPNCKADMWLGSPSRHDPYWYWLCKACRTESPKFATEKMALAWDSTAREPDAPTLSPEVQAVLGAAVAWRKRWTGSMHLGSIVNGNLTSAVDAYLASQKPKDYAPDELEPGQRFKFACREKALWDDPRMLVRDSYGKPYYINLLGHSLHDFDPGDRLIPLPEQDG